MNADIFTSIALHLSIDDVVSLCKSTHSYLKICTRQFWHRYFAHHNQILYDIDMEPNLLEYKLLFDFNQIIPYIKQYYPNDDLMTILHKMHQIDLIVRTILWQNKKIYIQIAVPEEKTLPEMGKKLYSYTKIKDFDILVYTLKEFSKHNMPLSDHIFNVVMDFTYNTLNCGINALRQLQISVSRTEMTFLLLIILMDNIHHGKIFEITQ